MVLGTMLLSLALLFVVTPTSAAGCRLALVLALDVSGSVDAREDRQQREGLAAAMLDPRVVQAFLTGDPVAIHVFEWSMNSRQRAILSGWQIVRDKSDLAHVAALVQSSRRGPEAALNPTTAVGSALSHAVDVLRSAPPCDLRKIDVSGDGENNDGPAPGSVYSSFPSDVTVNALVIGGAGRHIDPYWDDQRLLAWFEVEVVRGPGAFAVLANDYDDYARAMQLKLLREIELPLLTSLTGRTDAFK